MSETVERSRILNFEKFNFLFFRKDFCNLLHFSFLSIYFSLEKIQKSCNITVLTILIQHKTPELMSGALCFYMSIHPSK